MSESVTIKIYYEIGEISPKGVDLSNVSSVEKLKCSKSRRKNLSGYNQLAGQCIFNRFRAPMHVGDGTNQQKYTSVLGARGT
jgi:hypothetical protein